MEILSPGTSLAPSNKTLTDLRLALDSGRRSTVFSEVPSYPVCQHNATPAKPTGNRWIARSWHPDGDPPLLGKIQRPTPLRHRRRTPQQQVLVPIHDFCEVCTV
jgi:hypothetical protein